MLGLGLVGAVVMTQMMVVAGLRNGTQSEQEEEACEGGLTETLEARIQQLDHGQRLVCGETPAPYRSNGALAPHVLIWFIEQ